MFCCFELVKNTFFGVTLDICAANIDELHFRIIHSGVTSKQRPFFAALVPCGLETSHVFRSRCAPFYMQVSLRYFPSPLVRNIAIIPLHMSLENKFIVRFARTFGNKSLFVFRSKNCVYLFNDLQFWYNSSFNSTYLLFSTSKIRRKYQRDI